MSEFRLIANGKFVRFDEMTWPTPMDEADGGLEWRLRYASAEQLIKDRYSAASIVEAYRALIMSPVKRRNKVIAVLRRALHNGEASR